MAARAPASAKPQPRNLLELIIERRASLRPSEQLVADFVLRAPEAVTTTSMAGLAAATGVSEPTVLRFCHQLDCAGFPELKLKLAQSLVTGVPYVHREIALGDDTEQVVGKIFGASIHALSGVRDRLDQAALDRAVTALAKARRIECYGAGSAAVLAFDAQQKFFRLGIPTSFYPDTHLQITAAATLQAGDAVLCFSHTGAIKDIVRCAQTASASGATVIAVTRTGSPLAQAAHVHLAVDTTENTEVYAPMISRVAQMVVLDVLATGVALACGPAGVARLRKAKDSGAHLRIDVSRAPAKPRRGGL
jgi:RpiR family carbohydrate utilization transcriptional regulator